MELVGADFTSVSLLVHVEIENPNSIGITLSAYDYRLGAAGQTIVDGRRSEPLSLKAEGKSVVPIPINVGFKELVAVGTSLITDDVLPVDLGLGLEITLPYMGTVRLDISGGTDIPILRPPIIRPASIRVAQISLTGAEIILMMNVENPNRFDVTINTAEGRLFVGGREWGAIGVQSGAWIPKGNKINMELKAVVDFSEAGRTAWSLLTGSGDAEVEVTGTMDIDMDMPGFNGGSIPWDADAKVSIVR